MRCGVSLCLLHVSWMAEAKGTRAHSARLQHKRSLQVVGPSSFVSWCKQLAWSLITCLRVSQGKTDSRQDKDVPGLGIALASSIRSCVASAWKVRTKQHSTMEAFLHVAAVKCLLLFLSQSSEQGR